ncbi:MAG: hypothetical protein AAF591_23865 [Verrucomicrobiota bacterium]
MSCEYSIDPEANLIRLRWTGDFRIERLIEKMGEIAENEDAKPGMNILGDYREAPWVGEVGEMSDYVDYCESAREERGSYRSAVLLERAEDLDLVAMFDLVAKQRGLEIETKGFLDEESALEWLQGGE